MLLKQSRKGIPEYCVGPFFNRVVVSGKTSLKRGHLSRGRNEVREQVLQLPWGKAFHI